MRSLFTFLLFFYFALALNSQVLQLPTKNESIYRGIGEEFYVGTAGQSWERGRFGCVRSDGWRMHEGIDIKCEYRDKKGEPTDPIMATADGAVAYINRNIALSNYGKYIVISHLIEGLEIFSLYAHLSHIETNLKIGQPVNRGQTLGTMGRTTNTQEGISLNRAHVHFELTLFLNDHYSVWVKKDDPKRRNDHGNWNGFNLVGIDPSLIFLEQREKGDQFSLLNFIRNRTALFRVTVRNPMFPWVKRYIRLIKRNPVADKEGMAGFEIAFDFNGLPFQIVPRAQSEMSGQEQLSLLEVNAEVYKTSPCRKFLRKEGDQWSLRARGKEWIDLLTFQP